MSDYDNVEIKSKYYDEIVASLPALTDKVIVVTGTTSGTGYATALTLARKGAHIILLNRSSSRSVDSLQRLKELVPDAKVDAIECDLMDFSSVRKAAEQIKQLLGDDGMIDCLGLNAGVMALPDKATIDGYDVQMQTNHLSHFLLTQQLFSLVEKAAESKGEARIVSMTSEARKGAPLEAKYFGKNGGQLGGDEPSDYTGPRWARYHQTKLANCVFTYALHDRLQAKQSKVKALIAHPGLSATGLLRTTDVAGGMPDGFAPFFKANAMSAEDGACAFLLALVQKGYESGDFLGPVGENNDWKNGPPIKMEKEPALDDATAKTMLWTQSEKAVGSFTV